MSVAPVEKVNLIDYQRATKYSTQPFYKAGSTDSLKWVYRKEGENISAAGLIYDKDLDLTEDKNIVIAGSGGSGIAGTTFYQVQAQLIKP